MKIFDPKRHLPLGWDWDNTWPRLVLGHCASALPLFAFLKHYADARAVLYDLVERPDSTGLYSQYVQVLDPTRTIAPFPALIQGTPLLGLWIFLAVMPPAYEQVDLVVPSGHVNCCPCPDHRTNYVGVAYKSYRLRLVDANGLPFRSSGESCTDRKSVV